MEDTDKQRADAQEIPDESARRIGTVLLICVLVVPAWFVVWVAAFGGCRGRGDHGPSYCMANLKSTSSAIETYKADNRSRTPRLHKYGDPAQPLGYDTHADELWVTQGDEDRPTPALGTAAMQNVWLLIAKDFIPQDAFTCPRDPDFEERQETGVGSKYGWTSWRQVSYGLHYPYDGPNEATKNPAAWTDHIDGGVVLLADKHPETDDFFTGPGQGVRAGKTTEYQIKPSNHEKEGQSILFANGSASYYHELDPARGNRPKDSKCGKDGDDIYKAGAGGQVIPQTYVNDKGETIDGGIDSYIVPSSGHKPGG